MKISYNWLKSYISDLPEANKLADIFTYHLCEVEGMEKREDGDVVFDLNILPNRAHDLLSHQGVARELAGQLGIKFNDLTPKYKVPESKPTNLKIDLQTEKCHRYMARIVRNVKVGPSQDWVKSRLESIGQRSINNIVDATNITMYDSGQPSPHFVLDKLAGERIIGRPAKAGEKITLLSGEEKELKEGELVIADEQNALAIAGVKGGKVAEVDANTKNILIEVANFDPVSTRKTSRKLGIPTDSSKRFENDLSPELCSFAMLEISVLIAEIGSPERSEGMEFQEIVDIYLNKQKERKINFSTDFVNKKLGANISSDEIENILKQYCYTFKRIWDNFEFIPPVLRLDLVIPEDMVEEIGRVYGYDKVKLEIPKINFKPVQNEIFTKISAVREKLLADGYNEVMTYSFTNKGEVEVLASASDKKFLRTDLTDGIKNSYKLNKLNMALLGVKEIKIFEIGTIFLKDKEQINVATADKKGIAEMSLDKFIENYKLKIENYGNLVPRTSPLSPNFKMWSQYPFMTRDIAVWVGEGVESNQVHKVIKENDGELVVRGPELFDSFSKEGRISYAFRLVFQSYERTLVDSEVNVFMEKIYSKMKENGWEIR